MVQVQTLEKKSNICFQRVGEKVLAFFKNLPKKIYIFKKISTIAQLWMLKNNFFLLFFGKHHFFLNSGK